ncbi:MAG TPA: phytoene desaturase family protein [Anaerolineales bacterium]
MKARSVVIIGAGVGGLTAAIHLARHGLRVTVLEKNTSPGGRCNRLLHAGHRFDTGPTLFVMPRLYEAEFRHLGVEMDEQLDLLRVDPTYRLVFDDGSQLALTSDQQSMREQLEAIEPGSFKRLQDYLQEGGRHYQLTLDNLVTRDLRSPLQCIDVHTPALLVRLKAFVNHYSYMSAYVDDPRLKAAFTFQDIYMGLSPFAAPATFSLLPYTELAHGVYYPRGGMYSIVERLVELARALGVEFAFEVPVEQIEIEGARAHAVRLPDGAQLSADVVLANADLPYVYKDLLPQDGRAEALARKRFSCSVISFFWGVDKTCDALGAHTLFVSDGYRENFDGIERGRGLPPNPSLYVHAPARLDPSVAPPGRDTLTAIIPVGHIHPDEDQDWDAMRDQAREHVFRRLRTLGITDLAAHITYEATCTPPMWRQQYNLTKGSTHGLAHTLLQMAYFRPSNRHARYHNLYFVGASTHPGTGLPTAMVSGRLAATRIIEELQT